MPILLTGRLPNEYPEVNGYSTAAAYRDGHREVEQERTKAIIKMTFTEKRSTETILNAKSRDGEICKCNAQSGFPRAEALLLHVTMPGAEAHIIVRSQDDIHVMIHFPHITLANSNDRLCRDSTLRSESRTKLCVESQRLHLQSRITIELHFQIGDRTCTATEPRWRSTINIMEKSSTEQRNFK